MTKTETSVRGCIVGWHEVGPYWATTVVHGRTVRFREPITDPFINAEIQLGWRDLWRGLLNRSLEVSVYVGTDDELMHKVLHLDGRNKGIVSTSSPTRIVAIPRDWPGGLTT